MSSRTHAKDAIALIVLLAIYLLLFGCFRAAHYQHYPQCARGIPCSGHEAQVYCRDIEAGKWRCCKCPRD